MRPWVRWISLRPRSIAVIGASRERGTVGAEILHNLLEMVGSIRGARLLEGYRGAPAADRAAPWPAEPLDRPAAAAPERRRTRLG